MRQQRRSFQKPETQYQCCSRPDSFPPRHHCATPIQAPRRDARSPRQCPRCRPAASRRRCANGAPARRRRIFPPEPDWHGQTAVHQMNGHSHTGAGKVAAPQRLPRALVPAAVARAFVAEVFQMTDHYPVAPDPAGVLPRLPAVPPKKSTCGGQNRVWRSLMDGCGYRKASSGRPIKK